MIAWARKHWTLVIAAILILIMNFVFVFHIDDKIIEDRYGPVENLKCNTKAFPDKETDFFTYTLPDCASSTRLIIPYTEEELFANEVTEITGTNSDDGEKYFAIFEIYEDAKEAVLKIEYQKSNFPTKFNDKALFYKERKNIGRRQDAYEMGILESSY